MAQQLEPVQVAVRYGVPRWSPAWAVPEVPVPESDTHDAAIEYLRSLLLAWVERERRDAKIARNLGIRWIEDEPRSGFDPDLCVIDPAPPVDQSLTSLRLWEKTHAVPRLAIEIVSPGHPYKDYVDTPDRCVASGIPELWIFDPMLCGPRAHGGPILFQLWSHADSGSFERLYAGDGPVFSRAIRAWLHPQASKLPSGAKLRISDDEAGQRPWLTRLEQERAAREQERAARQAAEQRIRDLEAQLRERERDSNH